MRLLTEFILLLHNILYCIVRTPCTCLICETDFFIDDANEVVITRIININCTFVSF